MPNTCRGEFRANDPGLDLYLKQQLVQYGELPFEPGDEYVAVSLPDRDALVLLPPEALVETPLELTITERDLE